MHFFRNDLFRSLALGFVLGCTGMIAFAGASPLSANPADAPVAMEPAR